MKRILLGLTLCLIAFAPAVQASPNIEVDHDTSEAKEEKQQKFFVSSYGDIHYNNVDSSDDTL